MLPDAFVAEKAEGLVASVVELRRKHWTPDCSTKLITLQRRHTGAEEVARIQVVVLQKLKHHTVKFVGTALRGYIDHRARVSTKLGRIIRGLRSSASVRILI